MSPRSKRYTLWSELLAFLLFHSRRCGKIYKTASIFPPSFDSELVEKTRIQRAVLRGMVVHSGQPSTWEVEAGGKEVQDQAQLLRVPSQPRLHQQTNNNRNKKRHKCNKMCNTAVPLGNSKTCDPYIILESLFLNSVSSVQNCILLCPG